MNSRQRRKQRLQRQAERAAWIDKPRDADFSRSPVIPDWIKREADREWDEIPEDIHELRIWMRKEPINPRKPT